MLLKPTSFQRLFARVIKSLCFKGNISQLTRRVFIELHPHVACTTSVVLLLEDEEEKEGEEDMGEGASRSLSLLWAPGLDNQCNQDFDQARVSVLKSSVDLAMCDLLLHAQFLNGTRVICQIVVFDNANENML